MMHPEIIVERLGSEGEPVVTIDNFSLDPHAFLKAAKRAEYGPAGRHYPGLRAPAPADYLKARGDLIGAVLADVFGCRTGAHLIECNFSIVTTPPEALTPIQRLPHFDGADSSKLALLHYICPPEAGGTSFYRHRATGFETITTGRLAEYDAALRREVSEIGLPAATYCAGSTAQFERIGRVQAAFNRMVIYRGITLHSGDILQPEQIGQGMDAARITVNTFFSIR